MPDLSGAPGSYMLVSRPRLFRHRHDALSAKKRREQLTGGVTPSSAIAVTDLDFGAVVPAYLCAY